MFLEIVTVCPLEFLTTYLNQLLEVCVRVHSSTNSPDEAIEKETKLAADELSQAIEQKVGSVTYMKAFRDIQQRLQSKKAERKRQVAIEAVSNVKSFAERKVILYLSQDSSIYTY